MRQPWRVAFEENRECLLLTNENLAGTTASSYGFLVSDTGVGTALFNVGDGGAAFGVDDYTDVAVLDLLLATDDMAADGLLYDTDDSDHIDAVEQWLRTLANEVYTAINEGGDI